MDPCALGELLAQDEPRENEAREEHHRPDAAEDVNGLGLVPTMNHTVIRSRITLTVRPRPYLETPALVAGD